MSFAVAISSHPSRVLNLRVDRARNLVRGACRPDLGTLGRGSDGEDILPADRHPAGSPAGSYGFSSCGSGGAPRPWARRSWTRFAMKPAAPAASRRSATAARMISGSGSESAFFGPSESIAFVKVQFGGPVPGRFLPHAPTAAP